MDLKEFIKETVGGIVDATSDLQTEFEGRGVVVNPPISSSNERLYLHEDPAHVFRKVETIDFDVAVTAATETSGGGKAGLKVFSLEAGADGKHARTNEQVSRVRFSISIVLAPSAVEGRNKVARQERDQRLPGGVNLGPADSVAGY